MKTWRMALLLCYSSALPLLAWGQTAAAIEDYSGMYSFLREGEFVQITVEDKGQVTGFISRFGDSESDQGVFLDQFFKSGKLDGDKLSFTSESVHGVWFQFEGVTARGPGKAADQEAYYVLRGTLTRFTTDADKKTISQVRQVELKSFPRDSGTK
jgi:hypothetical protein